MRAKIIRIGNSQGVRIPKILLEQSRLGTEVELEVEDQKIVISPAARPRRSWDEKMRSMAEHGDDKLLDEGASAQNRWDKDEWEW